MGDKIAKIGVGVGKFELMVDHEKTLIIKLSIEKLPEELLKIIVENEKKIPGPMIASIFNSIDFAKEWKSPSESIN